MIGKGIPPIVPTPITADRQESWLRRLFAWKGRSLEGISGQIQLSLDGMLNRYTDQLLPAGVLPWALRNSAAGGGAANRTLWWLVNPAGSQRLITLDYARVRVITAGTYFASWYWIPYLTQLNSLWAWPRDVRLQNLAGNQAQLLPILNYDSTVPAATSNAVYWGAAFTLWGGVTLPAAAAGYHEEILPFPLVLKPGSALGIDVGTQNAATDASFFGTSRAATPDELNTTY